jgi:hypothetical protein
MQVLSERWRTDAGRREDHRLHLGIAFVMRSFTAERRAGWFVVGTIFVSACVAAVEAVDRLVQPQALHHLGVVAATVPPAKV